MLSGVSNLFRSPPPLRDSGQDAAAPGMVPLIAGPSSVVEPSATCPLPLTGADVDLASSSGPVRSEGRMPMPLQDRGVQNLPELIPIQPEALQVQVPMENSGMSNGANAHYLGNMSADLSAIMRETDMANEGRMVIQSEGPMPPPAAPAAPGA